MQENEKNKRTYEARKGKNVNALATVILILIFTSPTPTSMCATDIMKLIFVSFIRFCDEKSARERFLSSILGMYEY